MLIVGPSKTFTVGSLLALGRLLGATLTLGALLGDVGCSLTLGVWLGSNNGFVIRNGAKLPRRNGLGALLTLGSQLTLGASLSTFLNGLWKKSRPSKLKSSFTSFSGLGDPYTSFGMAVTS